MTNWWVLLVLLLSLLERGSQESTIHEIILIYVLKNDLFAWSPL
jgi:hypothetical protein